MQYDQSDAYKAFFMIVTMFLVMQYVLLIQALLRKGGFISFCLLIL